MEAHQLKLITKGRRGNGNEYQLGETTFRISRNEGFKVYDLAKGIWEGKEIFRMYARRGIDFHYGMREFKKWLLTSEYIKKK